MSVGVTEEASLPPGQRAGGYLAGVGTALASLLPGGTNCTADRTRCDLSPTDDKFLVVTEWRIAGKRA
jgi:hypothetical protein